MVTTEPPTTAQSLDPEIAVWRHETLVRAGYPHDVALVLAYRVDVDLHLAVSLLERGATVEQAIRILD